MRKIKFLMLSIFTVSILLTSCGETIDEAQVLIEFLESADSPVDVAAIPKYITAADVQALLPNDAYVIDIRSADDHNAGHIAGSIQVDAESVIAHLEGADTGEKTVVIACYTGQTAGFVTSLVNLSGFSAKSLKFGMSSWNESLDKVAANSKNDNADDLVTTVTDKAAEGDLPMLETGFETGQEILDAQIDAVNTSGFGEAAILATKVFDNPEDYYIVNYWPADHYALGHIPEAIQYTPNVDILSTGALKTLPTDKTIVVYCYSGQTSAFTAAYLKVLGYDAKSLKFGANGFATDWTATNSLFSWDPTKFVAGYDLATD
jgi:rhodanese-related sulfurtransferase